MSQCTQWKETMETKHPSASGGRSNNQRIHNLESDQAENLANNERIRTDIYEMSRRTALRSELYELTCTMGKMAKTMEIIQERLSKVENMLEQPDKYEKHKGYPDYSAGSDHPGGESSARENPSGRTRGR